MSERETPADPERERRNKITRNIFAIANEAGVADASDRIELARACLGIGEGITSYTQLTTNQLADILYGLRCWRDIEELRLANGTTAVQSRVQVEADGYVLTLPEEDAAPTGEGTSHRDS